MMLSSAFYKDGLTDSKFETISLITQQKPADHELKLPNFHQEIRRVAATEGAEGILGKFRLPSFSHLTKARDMIRQAGKLSGTVEHNRDLTREKTKNQCHLLSRAEKIKKN